LVIARDDVGRERVFVVYPGDERYELANRVSAMPLAAVAEVLSK
jgi:hypothetical protein